MKKLKQFFTHNLPTKTILLIGIIGIADVFTMAAPYYLKYIIPNIWDHIGITQSQFDTLNSILGYVVLATQIPGGWLTNKFSSKKMLTVSLFMTAGLAIWWTMLIQLKTTSTTSMPQLYAIYTGWGISTTLIFWAPLWKLLSQLGKKEDQGAVFGMQGALNGLAGLIFITALGTVATELSKNGNEWAFYSFSYMLCGFLILSGFLVWFFMIEKPIAKYSTKTDENNGESDDIKKVKLTFKDQMSVAKDHIVFAIKPMRSLRLWLVAFFVMGMYMFQSVFAYYMNSTLSVIGLMGTVTTIIAGVRAYGMRMIVSSPFGKWADKRKSYILVSIWVLSIGLICSIVFTIMPWFNTWDTLAPTLQWVIRIIMVVLFFLIGILSWFLVAIRYVQIVEIPYEKGSYGTVVGVISFIAFSPDAWFYQMASAIGAKYTDPVTKGYTLEGLQILLAIALATSLFGLICGTIAFLMNKKELETKNLTDYRWRKLSNE